MEVFEKDRQGMVLRIERSSVHDGDGFRTVVLGCPLRVQWCSTRGKSSPLAGKCRGKSMET